MTVTAELSRDDIIAKLRPLEAELRKRGVTSLAIFGSRSRGDARPDSDLDVLLEVDPAAPNELYVAFDVQHIIGDALGYETEAILRRGLGEAFSARIADDVIKVF